MELSVSLIEGIILLALGGVTAWMGYIHNTTTSIQIDLAKNYHSKEELRRAVDEAVLPIWREMERIARVLEKFGEVE